MVSPRGRLLTFVRRVAGSLVGLAALVAGLSFVACSRFPAVHDLQGEGPVSEHAEALVTVEGVITAISERGFWIESHRPDRSERSSNGLLVAAQPHLRPADLEVGTRVRVRGMLAEERGREQELPVTTIAIADGESEHRVEAVAKVSARPASLLRPSRAFATLTEAIAFWERHEGMLVRLPASSVVGPSNRFGDVVVVPIAPWPQPDLISQRGVPILDPGPEGLPALLGLVILSDELAPLPALRIGDRLPDLEAIVDYRFGSYRLLPTSTPAVIESSSLERERADPTGEDELSIATLNVENLDLGDGLQRFRALGELIVEHLAAPDLLALQEIQDDNGTIDDAITASDRTHNHLIEAIVGVGGPRYAFREIRPRDDEDGGEPGGNIRTSFLFRRDRGLRFKDRVAGDPTTTRIRVLATEQGPAVEPSPGRIAPSSPAFVDSRKPLVGHFEWRGRPLFVVNLHLASKSGDDPPFGARQPPRQPSALQRDQQIREVARFAAELLALDPELWLLVLGDCNDNPSAPLFEPLFQAGMKPLLAQLAAAERYTYIYQGQGQALDQAFASAGLLASSVVAVDIVHTNAEQPADERLTDHDSLLLRFAMAAGPTPTGAQP